MNTKAIIDNLKKSGAIPIIDKSQFLQAISVIDKSSPINFFDNRCGKFLMCLNGVFLDFSRKESSLQTLPWH